MIRRGRLSLGVFLFLATGVALRAQGFVEAASGYGLGGPSRIVLLDGLEISGRMTSASLAHGAFKYFRLVDESGRKTKYMAEEVARLEIELGKRLEMQMISESLGSVQEVVTTDFEAIVDRDHLTYEQVQLPGYEKPRLLQLLNPGFESRLRVYPDPRPFRRKSGAWSFGGIPLTEGKDRSFTLVKDAGEATFVTKKHYDEQFGWIFGDCEAMRSHYSGEKIKFKHLAEHVFVYDQLCGRAPATDTVTPVS